MAKLFRVSTVPSSLNVLLKGQLRFLDQYFDVTAISGDGPDLDEVREREGVKTYAIEMQRQISPFQDLISLIKLYSYFRKEKPDIVHSITPKAGLLSMIASRFAGVPHRLHTFTGLVFPYKKGIMQKILILMDKILCWCATDIYPEGNGVKKDLEKFKITKKPLNIIANGNVNGIDLEYFNNKNISFDDKKILSNQLGIREEDFVFVFIGRLVTDKGINELINVFKKLEKSNNAVKLLLVGSFEEHLDPLLPEIKQEIEQNRNIISVGFQKDIRPYLAISNVLVFPSYREGFPNVVLQALAMELPAIVTDISGSNEIVDKNINGLIIDAQNERQLYNAMLGIFTEKKLFEKVKKNTVYSIQKFENKRLWEELKKKYEEKINNK